MALSGDEVANKSERQLLSIVTPCFNESEVVRLFYDQVKRVLDTLQNLDYEIILVDDGSVDDTLNQMNKIALDDKRVRVCSLSRNFGHQIALTAGLDFALGDAIILMDSDLQHPPESIPELVKKWREGYEIVSAVRSNTQGASWFKDFTSNGFYQIFNLLSPTQVPKGAADFCLLSRRVCNTLKSMPERHRLLRGMVSWTGYKRALVPYVCAERVAGQSKYSLTKMVGLALDAVFSFSAQPLKLAFRLGLLMAVLGFCYLIWTVVSGLIAGNLVPGYASLIGVVITLGGCQLAFIGLIGEYLARVFEEVKGRPIYLVKQIPDNSANVANENSASKQ
ncbi:glycosyltransferase family 2 protein [Pseudomonadota bacterium]